MNIQKLNKKQKTLAMFAAVDLVLLLAVFPFIKMKESSYEETKEQETLNLQVVDDDIAFVENQIKMVTDNLQEYEQIIARGVLSEQDRLAAVRSLEEQREKNNLNFLSYSFSEAETAPSGNYQIRDYQIQTTTVTLNTSAFLDRDFFRTVHSIKNVFPGVVLFDSINLRRVGVLRKRHLQAIERGERPELVTGDITFKWKTLIKAEKKEDNI